MNRARDKGTGEFVEAEELWGQDEAEVDGREFLCEACETKVTPASYRKGNTPRPYFRTPKGKEHAPVCRRADYAGVKRRGQRLSVCNEAGDIGVPYPERFQLKRLKVEQQQNHAVAGAGLASIWWRPRSEEKERRKVFHMANDKKHNGRRRHTPEFKAGVVQLVRSGAKTVGAASRDLGLADSLIRTWMERADASSGGAVEVPLTASEKEELKHLRREGKVLRMEREILKQAATFFAKETA